MHILEDDASVLGVEADRALQIGTFIVGELGQRLPVNKDLDAVFAFDDPDVVRRADRKCW